MRRARLLASFALVLGCHLELVRWEAQGRHADVVRAAEQANRPPRRKAARAWADALVALGEPERARDVLLKDFRRGGQLQSLVQLAELERSLGLDGVAAVHWTRVIAIDRTVLRGDAEVCGTLRRRAQGFIGLGEGDAALDDLDRARALCGDDDAEARRRANVLARRRIQARADRSARCGDSPCATPEPSERAKQLEAGLAEASAAGPDALRRFARAHAFTLGPDQVIGLLLADARAETGPVLVDDDELRGWIGDAPPESFAAPLRAVEQGESAYIQLRLERVLGRTPTGGVASASQRTLWIDRARIASGVVDWRVAAEAGDLDTAEQALVARWRPHAKPEAGVAPRDPDSIAPSGTHWALRVPSEAGASAELLAYARLRDAAGDPELVLALARSMARDDAAATALVADAAARALGWGRPWLALALADASDKVDLEPVRAAAATAVLLGQAVCEGECADDAEELAAIERVLGEGWVPAMRSRLRELALDRPRLQPRAGTCPSVAEALGPEAATPLGEALALARRKPDALGLPDAITRAVESDPALACSGELLLPLLIHRRDRLTAARLAEMLAHGPELRSARALGLHAGLALVAEEGTRAELLAIAAAGEAEDPAERWRAHARTARALGDRNAELIALRELLLASTGLDHQEARRELLLRGLGDAWTSWGARDTEAGREAIRRNVVDYLGELAAGERWRERERIVEEIVQRPWYAPEAVPWLRGALLPDDVEPAHAVARLRLGVGTLPTEPAAWSDELLAQQIAARKVALLPIATTVFGEPTRFVRSRLALARHAREWSTRRRVAVGLAAYGRASERALALAELFAIATPKGRIELERLLLDGPSAIEPIADGPTVAAVGMVDDPQLVLRLVLGVPLAPALLLPELDPGADAAPRGREPGAPRTARERDAQVER